MPADNLFGAATEMFKAAAATAGANAERKADVGKETVRAGTAASGELGADRRQQMVGKQGQDLTKLKAQLDQQENAVTMTPQLALGLVKATGDKEWLKMVEPGPDGQPQKMRADMMLALFQHGMAVNYAKRSPKITQAYDANGKIRHAVVYTDEQGNEQELMLDAGITPENLNKGKGGKGKGGGPKDDTLQKQKAFIAAHEKQGALLNDATKSAQLKATNPDQYNRIKEEYEKDQDRYDQLVTELGKAGSGTPAKPGDSSKAGGSAPFDADALIKEALSAQ